MCLKAPSIESAIAFALIAVGAIELEERITRNKKTPSFQIPFYATNACK
jgi:hypothetical protein